jgi:hypothetical protein
MFMCRLFLGFNLAFVMFTALDNDKMKADYYDEDDYYVDLNDCDDYMEI